MVVAEHITSNLPLEEWTETYGTERLNGALLDRSTQLGSILKMNAESFRQSAAAFDKKAPAEPPATIINDDQSEGEN